MHPLPPKRYAAMREEWPVQLKINGSHSDLYMYMYREYKTPSSSNHSEPVRDSDLQIDTNYCLDVFIANHTQDER